MEFCNECGSLLYPIKCIKNSKLLYYCKMCGNEVVNKSPNTKDSILNFDINPADQTIWFLNGKE
jgi:DNA-directed RNA polymerase subunit M/transcription elongation factor TFIIS